MLAGSYADHARAQSKTGPTTALAVEVEKVQFEVAAERGSKLPEQVQLRGVIKNGSKKPIVITVLSLTPLGPLGKIYENDCPILIDNSIEVSPGGSSTFSCVLKPKDYVGIFEKAFATVETNQVSIAETRIGSTTQRSTVVDLKVGAANYIVALGGVVGALLLSCFASIQGYLSAAEQATVPPPSRSQFLTRFWNRAYASTRALLIILLRALNGGLIAIILIYITSGTSETLPIAIRVTDFSGGILVGLFSYSLGRWLHEKLNRSR